MVLAGQSTHPPKPKEWMRFTLQLSSLPQQSKKGQGYPKVPEHKVTDSQVLDREAQLMEPAVLGNLRVKDEPHLSEEVRSLQP